MERWDRGMAVGYNTKELRYHEVFFDALVYCVMLISRSCMCSFPSALKILSKGVGLPEMCVVLCLAN